MTGADVHDPAKEQRDTVRALALLSLFFFVLVAGAYLYTANWGQAIPRDGRVLVVGRDFLNFWMYGRAALTPDPGRFYDAVLYNQELATLLGEDYPGQNWSYPPSVMLPARRSGSSPYLQALLCWTVLGARCSLWSRDGI